MSVQTTYLDDPIVGFAGMKANNRPVNADSMVSAESSLEIPFGVMVAQDSADSSAKLPAASNAKPVGVVLHTHAISVGDVGELGTTGVKPGGTLNVVRKGEIMVTVEEAVAKGDRGYVRYAAGAGGTQLGGFRKSAVANETLDVTAQVVFKTTQATIGGLAVIAVDMDALTDSD